MSPEPEPQPLRWYVAGLLCLATTLNYLDRQTLSVLAHTIQVDLHLTTVDYSYITSAFLASYTVMYAVSGRLVDRLGTRRSFLFFVTGWSVADILHAMARNAWGLATFRFLLGATEPANFPAAVKAVSEWFPMRERALAVGIFNSGTAVGAALSVPVVSFAALAWGWRTAFVVTGAVGFLWVALWGLTYRPPAGSPALGAAAPRVSVPALLAMRETWGCISARVLIDPVTYFLIFWVPKYLQEERSFTVAQLGMLGGIPFVALGIGNLAGGLIPRLLTARGWTVNRARKTTIFASSCVIPVCGLLIPLVASPMVALALLGVLMFCHASWASVTLPAEVFPKEVVATVTGFGGALGGVAGMITQVIIGHAVQQFSFTPVFIGCSVLYLIAFFCLNWLIPELGVIRPVKVRT